MRISSKLALKISIVAIVSLIIFGYCGFQARNLIIGPKILVSTPINGADLADPLVIIAGLATNITRISLNDRPIFVDKHGNFSEKLLVPPGYTIIKLAAQDKFGRFTQKLIELNYTATTSSAVNVNDTNADSASTSTQDIIQ